MQAAINLYYNLCMKILDFLSNLITGFWKNGLIALCQIVLEHFIISLLVVFIIVYLCSDSETAIYAWFVVGLFAVYSALKAVVEIFLEIRNYRESQVPEHKILIIQKIGGKVFDLALCVVGIFQALRIFTHVSKITKSTSSAVNVVDDVASAISKILKDIRK